MHGAMISGGWVCALHVRTAGLGGAALGSDEEEIVYLAYVVIDVLTNQVSEQTFVTKKGPSTSKHKLQHPITVADTVLQILILENTTKKVTKPSILTNQQSRIV